MSEIIKELIRDSLSFCLLQFTEQNIFRKLLEYAYRKHKKLMNIADFISNPFIE